MSNSKTLFASLSDEIANLVKAASPSVVSVAARSHRPASGVALGGDLIITADHAVERDRDIGIVADGTRFEATLLGRDPATDIAVLRAAGLNAPTLTTAPPPPTGSLVVSVSRTASGTVSMGFGVITSVGGPLRTARGVVLPSIIRTDAALRPGTAGGALVDAAGRIVGITTPGLMRGLPVAIPAPEASDLARRLAAREPLGRGYLGISVQAVRLATSQREPVPDGKGLLIFGVASDGAAEKAGILVGDVLVRLADQAIGDAEDLQDSLVSLRPGTEVAVTLLRGGTLHQVAMTVGERPLA